MPHPNQPKLLVENIEQLRGLLDHHQVKWRGWTYPQTNTLSDLWRELQHGECVLVDHSEEGSLVENPTQTGFSGEPTSTVQNTLRREIRIARMNIRPDEQSPYLLTQERVIARPGKAERRGTVPAEKCLPRESFDDAVLRGLFEELSCERKQVQILRKSDVHFRDLDSKSYPGLKTRYEICDFEIVIPGLPGQDFVTVEYDQAAGKTIEHHWDWQTAGKSSPN